MKNMKKILVTGGAGFIGTNLCKKLLEDKKNYIFCLDNLTTGSRDNILELEKSKRFTFIFHDVVNRFLDVNCDEIYNLACPASPIQYQQRSLQTIAACVYGIFNILDVSNKNNNCKIFHASTSEVYGDPLEHPQKEEYWGNVNPIGMRACYENGKRCAETILFDSHRYYNSKIKIARLFNTYGENMMINDGRVISNFICNALQNKDLEIYGDGSQTRSFCYISDMIDGIIKFMNSDINFIGPVNLGNPNEEITILELADLIIELTESNSKKVFKDLPKDDPILRRPDISLAKDKLKWDPTASLKNGLIKTINYFKGNFFKL